MSGGGTRSPWPPPFTGRLMSLHARHFEKNLDRFETQKCTGPLFYRINLAPADIHFAQRSYWQAFMTVRNQVDT